MNKKLILILLLFLCMFLSGCSDGEIDWAGAIFDAWLNSNGVNLDEGLNLGDAGELVAYEVIGDFTNGEEVVSLEGCDQLLKDIEQADVLKDQALATKDVEKLHKAQLLRPDDVTYHEAEAIIWVMEGNSASVSNATTKADTIVKETVSAGGDCRDARLNQLWIRRDLLQDQVNDASVQGNQTALENMAAAIEQADIEINAIKSGEPNTFCANLGADN